MAKKNALGRGLGALIENVADEAVNEPKQEKVIREEIRIVENMNEIPVASIESNPFQPRTTFDEEALEELSESIRELGIVQPITVRKLDENKYQLISGERRLKASKLAGLEKIPAFIREANDQAMLEMALVENIQREDLDAIEVAISYQRLMEECDLTQENLSHRVGKKRATITNYLRLLKLPAEIQLGIRDKKLSMGHARAIVAVEETDIQLEAYQKVMSEELSVRKTEELVRQLKENKYAPLKEMPKTAPIQELSEEYKGLKTNLVHFFNANIEFKRTDNGNGKIVIPFRSDEDLERIVNLLNLDRNE